METLIIRNIDPDVKHKLRVRAANHYTTIEEEAREILSKSLSDLPQCPENSPEEIAKRKKRIQSVVGISKDRYEGKSTNEIMEELRGDE